MGKRPLLIGGGVVAVGLGAWLAFGFFGVHTLFIDRTVDEEAPVFVSQDGDGGAAGESDGNAEDTTPVVEEVVAGTFVDRSHPTSGRAVVLSDGSGQRFLRFEDFATDNGPDLFVYLSSAPVDAPAGQFDDDFVDLGVLKGNIGAQNYEVPPEIDLDHYSTVVIWCRRFAVVFGAAALA